MGAKCSKNSILPITDDNECFICLETCITRYNNTHCTCILYCHEDCQRSYEPYQIYDCPICRIDSNERIKKIKETIFIFLKYVNRLLYILCIPVLVGLIFATILYLTNNLKISFWVYYYSNFVGFILFGLFSSVIIIGLITGIKKCIECCKFF